MKGTPISLTTTGMVAAVVLLAMLRAGAQQVDSVTFVENGPDGLTVHAGAAGPGPWAGAISSVVPHPTDPDTLWIGSVNGGVWKTTNATHAKPTWVPLTDHHASLSIGALAMDPTFPNVLVAGIGSPSSAGGSSGPLIGLLRTSDGGTHWDPLGQADLVDQKIKGVVINGNLIIVSSQTGIWRSEDGGATFKQLGLNTTRCGNIVRQPVTALVADPVHLNAIYAAIPGSPGGVYASVDYGCSWTDISIGGTFGQPSGKDLVSDSSNIVLAVHDDGTRDVLYAALLDQESVQSGVFRSVDGGASWTSPDVPPADPNNEKFLSIQADPTSQWIFYMGGDARAYFRCNASLPSGSQCSSIAGAGGTINNSAPHEDSRSMAFDAAGNLLETDDGGIFERVLPRRGFGWWRSLNGTLSITETRSCAWDHIGHVAICGTQDNGVVVQQTPGASVWKGLTGADGGVVAVTEATGFSTKYYSTQRLHDFHRVTCLGSLCSTKAPQLLINGNVNDPLDESHNDGLANYSLGSIPIASHALNPNRLVIAIDKVYESDDAGDTLMQLGGDFSGNATLALAFGSAGRPNILYVGSTDGLFRHTTKFGAMQRLGSYTFGRPDGIALDPADWQSAWVLNHDPARIFFTSTGGVPRNGQDTWIDVTGNLLPGTGGAGAQDLKAIAFARGSAGSVVFVGADNGLYAMSTTQAGIWSRLRGAIPNALVRDLDYDAADDILLIATLGRGTWMIAHPGNISLPTALGDTGIPTAEVQASAVPQH